MRKLQHEHFGGGKSSGASGKQHTNEGRRPEYAWNSSADRRKRRRREAPEPFPSVGRLLGEARSLSLSTHTQPPGRINFNMDGTPSLDTLLRNERDIFFFKTTGFRRFCR